VSHQFFNDEGAGAIAKRVYKTRAMGGGTVQTTDAVVVSQLEAVNRYLGDMYILLSERNFSDDCFKVFGYGQCPESTY
jgi:hypothetical protein